MLLPGCALPERGPGVPIGQTTHATVLGLPNERFFPVFGVAPLEAEFNAALQRQRQRLGSAADAPMPKAQLLSASGGGENGVFGCEGQLGPLAQEPTA